jgi:predicted phosphodiesterase
MATPALHLSSSTTIIEEQHGAPLPPKADTSHVRLVVLSDTHGRHSKLPPLPHGDVLMHLGDVADRGNVAHIRSFVDWIEEKDYHRSFGEIVCIGGNHDRDRRDPLRIDLHKEYSSKSSIIYLQDEHCDLAQGRLRVYGASWDACEQEDFRQLDHTRTDHDDASLDLLLTHGNPFLHGGGHGWKGSKEITRTVNRHGIPLHLFGHVHWGRGAQVLKKQRDATNCSVMVNCATTWNEPVVIDWDPVRKVAAMVHCPKPNLFATAGKLFVRNERKAFVH